MPKPRVVLLSGTQDSAIFSKVQAILESKEFNYKVYTAPGAHSFRIDSLTNWEGKKIEVGSSVKTLDDLKNLLEGLRQKELEVVERASLPKK
jgi:hypothetical protein